MFFEAGIQKREVNDLRKSSIGAIALAIVHGLVACGSSGGGDSQGTGGNGGSGTRSGAQSGATTTGSGSGTGGGSTTGTIDLDAGQSSGSTGMLDPDAACVADSREGSRSVIAMYFMVDISGSMRCPVPDDPNDPCEVDPGGNYSDVTRWTEASAALEGFFAAPESAAMWAGIGFFPRSDNGELSCNPDDYQTPDQEIGELPNASNALDATIEAQSPGGNTPTLPSLEGAIVHAQDWADAHPDHQAVVVYLTDGYPRGCGDNNAAIGAAADAADAAFNGTPSIRTYVLGVGSNLTDLDQIAEAGGTGEALFVDAGQNVTAQLAAALNEIREEITVDCTYTIPDPPDGRALDYDLVNVRYTNSAGETIDIGRDPSDTECNEGWQYSDDKTQIKLCGDACAAVEADPNVELEVLFGCATMVELR